MLFILAAIMVGYAIYDFNTTVEVTEIVVHNKEVVIERDDNDVDYNYYIYTNKGQLSVNSDYGFNRNDPAIYRMIVSGKRYRVTLRGWKTFTRIIDEATEIPVAEVDGSNFKY